jgi:hypothetical protein
LGPALDCEGAGLDIFLVDTLLRSPSLEKLQIMVALRPDAILLMNSSLVLASLKADALGRMEALDCLHFLVGVFLGVMRVVGWSMLQVRDDGVRAGRMMGRQVVTTAESLWIGKRKVGR